VLGGVKREFVSSGNGFLGGMETGPVGDTRELSDHDAKPGGKNWR